VSAQESAQAAPGGGGGGSSLSTEAAELTAEIEARLRGTGLLATTLATTGAAVGEGVPATAPARPALSRMNKAQLVDECKERTLPSEGTVAELRAQLRLERKRDSLVLQLVERGWSERQAQSTLVKVGWDLEAAIAKLTKG